MALNKPKGVLLVNLGTPDNPDRGSVYRYLKQFLLDPRVIDINWFSRNLLVRGIIAPFRSGASSKLYKQLWTEEGSPLKVYGYKLVDLVQESLGDDYLVELAMRYQNPSMESALNKLLEKDINELIVLPLFPQYASASTGSVYEEIMRLLSKNQNMLDVKIINSFYDHPKMIEAFAQRGLEHDIDSYDHVLFSFHGLPQRQIRKGDPYKHCFKENCCSSISEKNQHCYCAQSNATARAIAKKLNIPESKYTISYQSRLGRDPWVQPYTSDVFEELSKKGVKRILVFCPAFIADCLETSIEISVEYNEEFQEMGGEVMQLVEGLNDHPLWIEAVSDLIIQGS